MLYIHMYAYICKQYVINIYIKEKVSKKSIRFYHSNYFVLLSSTVLRLFSATVPMCPENFPDLSSKMSYQKFEISGSVFVL